MRIITEIEAAKPPTPLQRDVLDFIECHYREVGIPPTVREIQVEFGMKSPNSVQSILRHMLAKGLVRPIRRGASCCRWVPVVPEGACPCCGR